MLSGCAAAGLLTGGGPPPATYDLTAPVSFGEIGATGAQLAVTEPTAVGALNSERIVVRPSPAVVTYLAGVKWNDRLPVLVQARLIETFQNTQRVAAVAPPGGAQVSDFGLVTDLRDFSVKAYEGTAAVEVSARIISDDTGRVVASRIFTTVVPLTSDDAEVMTAGLNEAFDGLARDIVDWTLARI